jgi:glycosyltransferase involved in cell wall biosynthesis
VDRDHAGAKEGDRFRCFLVGRVNGKKGHLEAIMAVNRLRALGVNGELTLAGAPFPGQERHLEALQLAVEKYRWVRYVGEVDGLETLCATHDVCLCLPQFLEPFGVVALEAWSHGTRVVGLDVGGAQECLRLVDAVVVDDPSPAGVAQCLAAVAQSSRLRGPPAKTAPASRLCTPQARQAVWRSVLEQCA